MAIWKPLQYVSSSDRHSIDDWRKGLPLGPPRVYLDRFLSTMVQRERWEWPELRLLRGHLAGLSELRWTCDSVPYRIIGYKTREYEYLMLIGCTHNKKKYTPSDALDTAHRRREAIRKGEASSDEYQLLSYK